MEKIERPRRLAILAAVFVVSIGTLSHAFAGALLTLRDTTTTPPTEIALTAADIDAIPVQTIRTHTDFTDGVTEFTGPRIMDLLALIGTGSATEAHVIAANDYSVEIPLPEFTKYGVILAREANGKRLSPRGKGPFWVMYPLDDFSELQDPVYNNRLIWQVTKIELR